MVATESKLRRKWVHRVVVSAESLAQSNEKERKEEASGLSSSRGVQEEVSQIKSSQKKYNEEEERSGAMKEVLEGGGR